MDYLILSPTNRATSALRYIGPLIQPPQIYPHLITGPTQALGHPGHHSHLCQKPVSHTSDLIQTLGCLGPAARPGSAPQWARNIPRNFLHHQCIGPSLRIFWILTPPTSGSGPALGSLRPRLTGSHTGTRTCPPAGWQAPHEAGTGSQLGQGPALPTSVPTVVNLATTEGPHSPQSAHPTAYSTGHQREMCCWAP